MKYHLYRYGGDLCDWVRESIYGWGKFKMVCGITVMNGYVPIWREVRDSPEEVCPKCLEYYLQNETELEVTKRTS